MRRTLASLVEDWRRWGAETAVVVHRGNRAYRTSYEEMALLTGRFAAELERRGIGAGERVVIWGENSPEWMAVFFGCLLRGALAVPLDAAGTAAFAGRVVGEVGPRVVVGGGVVLGKLAAINPGPKGETFAPSSELDGDPGTWDTRPLSEFGVLAFEGLVDVLPPEPLWEVSGSVGEDSPFQIVFTSGTTSEPKGVVHTHRNVLASLRPIETEIGKYRRYERWVHPLRFLHTLPFSHVFGQFMGLWIPTVLGAELHLPANVEPARVVATIRRERISVLVAVPRVLELLREHVRGRFPGLMEELGASAGVPAWKRWWRFRRVHRAFGLKFWACICGGATLPAELEGFWNGLGFALIQGYGMTETAALVTLNHPFKVGRGTLGKALPGREVRLSEEGEILVRGDVLAAGAWRGGRFEPRAEEWLRTGDLATKSDSGELRFTGRRGDVIVTAAGMNVYPQDVEAALNRQAGVRGAVVVGCGAEVVGVVLFGGDSEALRGLVKRANGELASFQQMRLVLPWPERHFPYTSTGKLLRRQVADWACAERVSGTRTGLPVGDGDALVGLIEEVTRQQVGDRSEEARLTEDCHLDSLGRVQLQSMLEDRIGVEIRDEVMAGLETLGQLRGLLGRDAAASEVVASGKEIGERQIEVRPEVRRLAYPRWPWWGVVQWVRGVFVEGVVQPLVWLLAKPRIVMQQAPVDGGPLLIVANHVNTYDLPLVLYALPGARRRWVAAAMSGEVLGDLRWGRNQGSRVLNLLARVAYWLLIGLFNVFPLPRLSGFRESFAHAGEALDRGYSVLVFPEGRRGWTGELGAFRPGIGLLVQASRVPVLPVALQGMGAAHKSGRWFRSGHLAVHMGAPLVFGAETAEEITAKLEKAVRALGPS